MSGFDWTVFLPLCGGLTLIGLIASWFAWRRRGAAAGLRGIAWSLLPMVIYLLGVAKLFWRFGTAIVAFAGSFVFSPLVWLGVALAGLSAVLFVVSGGLRSRRARRSAATGPKPVSGSATRPGLGAPPPAQGAKPAKGKAAAPADDDLEDVEEILRRRGIR